MNGKFSKGKFFIYSCITVLHICNPADKFYSISYSHYLKCSITSVMKYAPQNMPCLVFKVYHKYLGHCC